MKIKLCLLLADCPINYCGGLGVRFNKMMKKLEEHYDLKIFTNCPNRNKKTSYDFNTRPTYISEIKSSETIFKLNYGGLTYHIFSPLVIIDYIYKNNWVPDIVLGSDHNTISTGIYLSKIFNTKFILEYDLALFSYKKLYDVEKLSGENRLCSNILDDFEKIGCYEADLVIMCSDYYKNTCPYKMKKVVTVDNGIDMSEFNNDVKFKFPHSNENDINIVFIGRLNSQKGVEFILNLKLKENIKIYFVGPKLGSNLYFDVIEACDKIPNFYYLGEIKGDKKIELLKSADAILFPSCHEPFGIVGLEAMAAKTICITTRVDGIATYMTEDMCIEIKNYNLSDAIDRLLNMSKDEKDKIINKAYEHVKKYDWNIITDKMIKAIDSVR